MPPKRQQDIEDPTCQVAKAVIVGEAFVGKSCLATRVAKGEFSPTQEPTIGAAFVSYRTTVDVGNSSTSAAAGGGRTKAEQQQNSNQSGGGGGGGASVQEQNVKLELWDTAGQERFKSLTPMYFRGAVAGVVVYDISAADTLRKARNWINDLRKTRENMAIILVGNKCDLPPEKRQVPVEEGEALAEDEAIIFFETSAKSGENCKEVFDELARQVVKRNLAHADKSGQGRAGGGGAGGKAGNLGKPAAGGGGSGGDGESKCKC